MSALPPLFCESAVALARRIRLGELSCADLVELHIEHITRLNPALNAMVKTRFDAAREESRAADAAVADANDVSTLPPLHGVPCTIKECFAVTGMPQSAGLVERRALRATHDATVVARIKASGAIILGVSNTSELCMWMESDNRVYGRTNNPYDPRRSAGGSSGGEGALVGAGLSPWGLGSDVGGSIRIPAAFCGVFGHKPSGGLVPSTGQFPSAQGGARRFLTTGPLTRRAEDLRVLLGVLAGPDGKDRACTPISLDDDPPSGGAPAGASAGAPAGASASTPASDVVIARFSRRYRVDPALVRAVDRAADALTAAGRTVREVDLPSRLDAGLWWAAGLTSEGNDPYATMLGLSRWRDLFWQFAKAGARRSPHTLPSLVLATVDRRIMGARTIHRLLDQAARVRQRMQEALDGAVLLAPSFPEIAPRHQRPMRRPLAAYITLVFNVLELPVTQVPMGLDDRGLPVGVQVVGAHGQDMRTIRAAEALERAYGGWTPPSRLWSSR